jgi:hypothetical protein
VGGKPRVRLPRRGPFISHRVGLDDEGSLDEIFVSTGSLCWLHLEHMGGREWFLGIGSRALWILVGTDGEVRITGEETR